MNNFLKEKLLKSFCKVYQCEQSELQLNITLNPSLDILFKVVEDYECSKRERDYFPVFKQLKTSSGLKKGDVVFYLGQKGMVGSIIDDSNFYFRPLVDGKVRKTIKLNVSEIDS